MKRLNVDGVSLVTGTAVANKVTEYAENVARMRTSSSVEVPVLEENGKVAIHTLLLTAASTLETVDVDGGDGDELSRFPVPRFSAIGGQAVAISTGEISVVSLPIDE